MRFTTHWRAVFTVKTKINHSLSFQIQCCFVLFPYRYRTAFIWQDRTVDYAVGIVIYAIHPEDFEPKCTVLASSKGFLGLIRCKSLSPGTDHGFICQYPDESRDQNIQLLTASPSLARINVTTLDHNGNRLRLVICPSGHATHTFLACDVATKCWAKGRVITSLLPHSWALPTSQSCPAKMAPLPPSFLCRSEEQHVPYTLVCDHRPNCLDGSDEKFCTYPPCHGETQFQCLNKQVSIECCYLHHVSVP